MFRRRVVVFRRPRIIGAALIGGLGFAAGRATRASGGPTNSAQSVQAPSTTAESPDLTARLKELADLHASGALSDQEFAAAKARLLG